MSWVVEAGKLEAKRILSYRVDFWLQFAVAVMAEVVIAFFLWDSIYNGEPGKTIGGYTFHQMLLYYLFVPFVARMVRSLEDFAIANEIKDGGLNKFLIYPLSFIQYKFVQKFVYTSLAILQMFLGIFFVAYLLGVHVNFSVPNFSLGILAAFCSMILYSVMLMSLEMVSFWGDTVWSLGVMLRFITMFFGGSFVPLNLLPEWGQKILVYTPFPYLFSNPIKIFMGELSTQNAFLGIGITLLWAIPLGALMLLIFKRGLKGYTGVGI